MGIGAKGFPTRELHPASWAVRGRGTAGSARSAGTVGLGSPPNPITARLPGQQPHAPGGGREQGPEKQLAAHGGTTASWEGLHKDSARG